MKSKYEELSNEKVSDTISLCVMETIVASNVAIVNDKRLHPGRYSNYGDIRLAFVNYVIVLEKEKQRGERPRGGIYQLGLKCKKSKYGK